jgi:hypothetical protein
MASQIAENAKRAHAFMVHVAELDEQSRVNGCNVKQHIGVGRFQPDYITSHNSPEFNCVYCGEHWRNHQTSGYNFCPTASDEQRQRTILEHEPRSGKKQDRVCGRVWNWTLERLKNICPW